MKTNAFVKRYPQHPACHHPFDQCVLHRPSPLRTTNGPRRPLFRRRATMPGPTSLLSRRLADVRVQLKTTRTRKGRDLEPAEITALEQQRDQLIAKMRQNRQEKFLARIQGQMSEQADRVIEEVPRAVRAFLVEELDKRVGPPPANELEEALAARARNNKRIRDLRKEATRHASAPETSEQTPAGSSDEPPRQSAEDPAFARTLLGDDFEPEATLPIREATSEDLELIQAGYHANWLPEQLRRDLWEYTLTRQPYFVKFRGHDVKTRPKIIFADPNGDGEYPLYRWGQERQSYDLVEKIPPPVRAVMDLIEARFGAKTNLAMATYYWNGNDHYIPVHCDKKVTLESEGRVETASRIFNISLGAVRPFLVTTLSSLGKTERADMDILAEFPMQEGDLYVLEGEVNRRFGHGVPRDPRVKDLRVSWVFRTVDACFVNPSEQTFREAAGKVRRIQPGVEKNAKRQCVA